MKVLDGPAKKQWITLHDMINERATRGLMRREDVLHVAMNANLILGMDGREVLLENLITIVQHIYPIPDSR